VAGRHLPRGLAPADPPDGWSIVGPTDLRFTVADVGELLAASASDGSVEADPARDEGLATEIVRHTDGWPAAVDLMVSHRRARPAGRGSGPQPLDRIMAALVDRLLAPYQPAMRAGIVRLGSVPLLSRDVAAALGSGESLEAAEAAGLPLRRRPDGWLTLSDPVRDALSPPALERDVLRQVADLYCRAGELSAAVHALHAAGDGEGIAAVLGRRPWTELEAAGISFARVVAGLIDERSSGGGVDLLVNLARAVEHGDPAVRRSLLAKADASTAAETGAIRRMVLAERAGDACRQGDLVGADQLVEQALAGASSAEVETRARALYAQGIADTIRCTPPALARAAAAFADSAALAELSGQYRWAAQALLRLGYSVCFHGGDIDAAIAPIEQALALAPSADRARAVTLTYLADVFDTAGRVGEADAACREALAIGQRLRDRKVIGYACWSSAWLTAHLGDHAATLHWLSEAERNHGPWLDEPNGTEFYLAAADMLASLGDEAGSRRYLEIGRQRTAAENIPDAFAPALARYEATFGDPERADAVLADLAGRPFSVPRGNWSRAMLRAYAAHRREDTAAARAFRALAATEAARCGHPDLPARHERWLDERLRAYDPAARDADAATRTELQLLGTFSLRDGAVDRTPQHGHPATLVKLLALRGPLAADELTDGLWPDLDAATGRARLRNTLNRLRGRSGNVVERRGETIALSVDVEIDVAGFDAATDRALDAPPHERAGLARRAAALYRGELLPGDRYADWAAAARERLRRRYLALVDLLAADAEARGDIDEAVRQLDAGMAIEPLDEERPVRAARLLLVQGRRASARDVVRRAVAVVDELGVAPGVELDALIVAVRLEPD